MDWYLAAMKDFARFDGRAHRREYWSFFAVAALLSFLLGTIAGVVSDLTAQRVGYLVTAIHLLPQLAVGSRRLHDVGVSGWWQLLGLVPVVGLLILFVVLLLPSRGKAARFGPPPDDRRVLGLDP